MNLVWVVMIRAGANFEDGFVNQVIELRLGIQ